MTLANMWLGAFLGGAVTVLLTRDPWPRGLWRQFGFVALVATVVVCVGEAIRSLAS